MNTSIYGIRYLYINICKHTCVNISSRSDGVGSARIQTGDSIRYCVHCFLCFVQFLLSIGWSQYPTITITDTWRCNGEKNCKGGILFLLHEKYTTSSANWNIVLKDKAFAEKSHVQRTYNINMQCSNWIFHFIYYVWQMRYKMSFKSTLIYLHDADYWYQ